MNVLALCAGVGGLELGIRLAVPTARTVCYVEREAVAATILVARMEDGLLDEAPIWDDVGTFDGKPWRGLVDCITGGYPCQPFSSAGRRRGTDDPRHLWPHFARIIREVGPRLCFFENVDAHLTLGYAIVRTELVELGFRVAEGLYTAAEVGAPHLRKRLFIMAHSEGGRASRQSACDENARMGLARSREVGPVADTSGDGGRHPSGRKRRPPNPWDGGETLADAQHGRRDGGARKLGQGWGGESERGGLPNANSQPPQWPPEQREECNYWSVEPDVGRVAHGVAARVDRLRACGNGVVPAVAARAWRELSSLAE